MPVIDTLEAQLRDIQERAQTLIDSPEFDADNPEYKALTSEADKLTRAIRAQSEWTQRKAATDEASAVIRRAQHRADAAGADATPLGTLGEVFTRSAQFGAYQGYGNSGKVDTGLLTRALPMTTADFPKALSLGARPLPEPQLLTPLLDLVPTVVTSLGSFPVYGLKVASPGTNPAAVVAEGSQKPSVEFDEDTIAVTLETVAVWTQITRQALEDVPMIRSAIDTKLRQLVLAKAEERVAAAITGATLPTATVPADGGTLLGAIRVGMADVMSRGYSPNFVALNPADWAAIDVASLVFPQVAGGNGVWGLRPVAAVGVTAGSAIVGSTVGVTRYERSAGVALYLSDSHADTFIKNVFTILAELRDDTVVERPDAFAKVSVAEAP